MSNNCSSHDPLVSTSFGYVSRFSYQIQKSHPSSIDEPLNPFVIVGEILVTGVSLLIFPKFMFLLGETPRNSRLNIFYIVTVNPVFVLIPCQIKCQIECQNICQIEFPSNSTSPFCCAMAAMVRTAAPRCYSNQVFRRHTHALPGRLPTSIPTENTGARLIHCLGIPAGKLT